MAHTELPASVAATLDQGLAALGLSAVLSGPLLEYVMLLHRWNRSYNLTAIRDPQAMVTRHLLDSLSLLSFVGSAPTLADLGTGPGLPGIPLALARPALQVTLVESNGKKVRFLREVARTLTLGNVQVEQSRIEAFNAPGQFAAITARALDTLAGIITVGGHLLADGGQLLAMKGAYPHAEIAALPDGWQVNAVHSLRVPGLDAERHVVVIGRDTRIRRSV